MSNLCDLQHIGLHMFSPTCRPKRIYQMTHGVLNLPRNPLLDWVFGHSLINCHVEHHLFPFLSDNMCLKVRVRPRIITFYQFPHRLDVFMLYGTKLKVHRVQTGRHVIVRFKHYFGFIGNLLGCHCGDKCPF